MGYVWDGTSFLILSSPTAPKVRNLRHNPKAALHLDMDEAAKEGVLTLEGVARLELAAPGEPAPLPEAEAAFYVERYRSDMADAGLTPAEALLELSTVIRVKPTRSRAY